MSEVNETPETQTKLAGMIKEFFTHNQTAKTATKLADPLNKQIKQLMAQNSLAEFESDGLLATYNVQERSSANNEKLLQRLKDSGITQAIKTIETVNSDVLERMIYDGELDATLIADCFDTKMVEVLSVKLAPVKKVAADE